MWVSECDSKGRKKEQIYSAPLGNSVPLIVPKSGNYLPLAPGGGVPGDSKIQKN
jgi:hypothetical protein